MPVYNEALATVDPAYGHARPPSIQGVMATGYGTYKGESRVGYRSGVMISTTPYTVFPSGPANAQRG